jgi:signal peptidase I
MQIQCSACELTGLLLELLQKDKAVDIRVHGESMYPTIRDLDVVRIEPVKGNIKNKEILLYKDEEERAVIHRVIKILGKKDRTGYLMRGDRSLDGEEVIKENQIMGRIASVKRNGRDIPVESMKRWQFFIFLKIIKASLGTILNKPKIKY